MLSVRPDGGSVHRMQPHHVSLARTVSTICSLLLTSHRCHCKAQFCYVCGEPWKTCECPQWDEDRLTIRAAEIATRHPNRRLYQPGQAPRRADDPATIAAIAAHLRDHHLCIHEHWQRLEGPHTCEQCGDDLRNFIFECRQCLITRCYRCVEDLL